MEKRGRENREEVERKEVKRKTSQSICCSSLSSSLFLSFSPSSKRLTHDFLHALSKSSRSLEHCCGTTRPPRAPRAVGGDPEASTHAAYASLAAWQRLRAERRTEVSEVSEEEEDAGAGEDMHRRREGEREKAKRKVECLSVFFFVSSSSDACCTSQFLSFSSPLSLSHLPSSLFHARPAGPWPRQQRARQILLDGLRCSPPSRLDRSSFRSDEFVARFFVAEPSPPLSSPFAAAPLFDGTPPRHGYSPGGCR